MAKPTIPLEIWAAGDIVLPNTRKPNKERPINDLWSKGYDLGQKPGAEEHNYLFNMMSSWIKYISDEQIPGLDKLYLKLNSNLSDVPNKATARNNLEVFSKTEADGRYVNITGDTMTGNLKLPRIDFNAATTDGAWITARAAAADWTYFDFGISDNPGNAGTAGVDTMRFRFMPSGGAEFSMMELNATNNTTGYLRIFGNLNVRDEITSTSVTVNNATVNQTLKVSTAEAGSLKVNNNNAVVAGRNIVRAVNGATADANGNLTIALPSQGVQQIRFGARQSFKERGGNERLRGGVMTSWADFGSSNYWVYLRPLQYYINGSWVTAAYV